MSPTEEMKKSGEGATCGSKTSALARRGVNFAHEIGACAGGDRLRLAKHSKAKTAVSVPANSIAVRLQEPPRPSPDIWGR